MKKNPLVSIVMGSDSDLPVMKEAAAVLEKYKIAYEIAVVSAHRTPDEMYEYAGKAKARGVRVIIAGAGGSAHLPGMVASLTTLPVLGVPIKTSKMSGLDSLLSIVQMPEGIPVGTLAINGARNAGLLAARIIGSTDKKISGLLEKYRGSLRSMVEKKSSELKKMGYASYLKKHGLG